MINRQKQNGMTCQVDEQTTVWVEHKVFRKRNEGLCYSELLSYASEAHTKKKKPGQVVEVDPKSWLGHINRWKEANSDWRTMNYRDVLRICKASFGCDE
jgi:hypothetical protein